jgi:hypothetical protein
MTFEESERRRVESLQASTSALRQANERLRDSVGKLPTIPPKAPVCVKCGKPRRPFAAKNLCEVCHD